MIRLKKLKLVCSMEELKHIPDGKLLINTINAFSYITAKRDIDFATALIYGDVLIPDGMSIVKACEWLHADYLPKERIAGWDLFLYEMKQLNIKGGKTMFLGSSEKVLDLIREKASMEFPNLDVVTYSPPYKSEFSDEDNQNMIKAINNANPDLLWIGMTAPKQEKWAFKHWSELNIHCHCGCIGAVFDFFAGTTPRAPLFWQRHGMEWFYRLMKNPRRLWKRYLLGNLQFVYYVLKEGKWILSKCSK